MVEWLRHTIIPVDEQTGVVVQTCWTLRGFHILEHLEIPIKELGGDGRQQTNGEYRSRSMRRCRCDQM